MKRIVWTDPARTDVRSLSKPTAMHILSALHRFAESGAGDVKALQGREELRLRIGDYRLFFVCPDSDTIEFAASGIGARRIGELRVAREARPSGAWIEWLPCLWFCVGPCIDDAQKMVCQHYDLDCFGI